MTRVSSVIRMMGRIIIVAMILTLSASRWISPEAIVRLYASSYENFRVLLSLKRIETLPNTKEVTVLLMR